MALRAQGQGLRFPHAFERNLEEDVVGTYHGIRRMLYLEGRKFMFSGIVVVLPGMHKTIALLLGCGDAISTAYTGLHCFLAPILVMYLGLQRQRNPQHGAPSNCFRTHHTAAGRYVGLATVLFSRQGQISNGGYVT